ncbi:MULTISPECIES: thiopeptide-type bacteriocin biosynthesis protein [unclassified Streptomyces]|uniref:thiopeptide-type bacteriocin biosynthesis protein n=1 Tax=unclassified Streptomyces TaxID=2593676 RepID=UPI00226F18EB|nr:MULTISPECIES: thiopeptide-type bacteriocin biosynthesis protein [unclassified Streptomyces]MCY0922762.1 thiopeptide-type bacteriocin biosynthesis protein [Streptomyces sp. H27-G5]MCY0957848.1 thiopeptide-type bacteriocin biosynthesis protein [Streptomyces sp. H27-H5]
MTEAIDATGGRWFSLHLFPRFARATGEDTDAFLVEDLAPLLDGLVSDRRATSWFYVRHVDVDGPHLRVRVRDLTPAGVAALHAEATLLVKERLGEGAEVHEAPYIPETERFGGPAALPVTEDVFALSTRVALDGLARTGHGGERLALAGDLAQATAAALGMDRYEAARWLRWQTTGWRWSEDVLHTPAPVPAPRAEPDGGPAREELMRRADAVRHGVANGIGVGPVARWAAGLRDADARLEEVAGRAAADDGADRSAVWAAGQASVWTAVRASLWASHLHLLFNRLGVAPDEQRTVCRLASHALTDTGERKSHHPEDLPATDAR